MPKSKRSSRAELPPPEGSSAVTERGATELTGGSRIRRALPWGALIIGGCLHFLGFAGFDLWPLNFVALVPLLLVLEHFREARKRKIFLAGLVYGFVEFAGGFYWMVTMLETFSGFGVGLSAVIASVFFLYQGLFSAFFALAYVRLRGRGVPMTLAAVVTVLVLELLFPQLFPSYWANGIHQLTTMIQIADIGGVLLISAFIIAVNGVLAESVLTYRRGRSISKPPVAAILIAAALIYGYGTYRIQEVESRLESAPELQVAMVQVNMGLIDKREDPAEGLRRHIEQSVDIAATEMPDLFVWPESAFGYFLPTGIEQLPRYVTGGIEAPVLFGGLRYERHGNRRSFFNTAFLIDADRQVRGTYDKTFLLAFGEYMPLGDTFPFLYDISPHTGQFTRGSHVRALPLGDYRIATLICYEDVLPYFTRRMVNSSDPHLLVNITNDSWFGDTTEPWIHLALAKFRAVEHHRYLARATNSGVSAFVDPVGRVMSNTQVFTRENLVEDVHMLQGTSVYAQLGAWPGYLSVIALLFWGFFRRWKGREASS